MILGSMNNPRKDVLKEIERIIEMEFDFMELTAEAPSATPELLRRKESEVKDALSTGKLKLVGHTPWFFEISHPYAEVRKRYMEEMKEAIDTLAGLGAEKVTIHPDPMALLHPNRERFFSAYERSVMELNEFCKELGVLLLIETYEEKHLSPEELGRLLNDVEGLGFTLDVGHANLIGRDGLKRLLEASEGRLKHVHASDNDGVRDLHLPIGSVASGGVSWKEVVKALKDRGYDDTITLEIFSPDLDYLRMSKERFREVWTSL